MRFVVLLLLSLGTSLAQTNRTSLPEHRFLLIVETSRPMEKRTSGIASALDQLFRSSMQGQIRSGETIGVWTYNDELHAGDFPLQTWSGDPQRVSNAIMPFLAKQKFGKQPRFDHVLSTLDLVISNSPLLTVIILSSGTDLIKGTPFDNEINGTIHKWRDEQQKARMPFVIVLRAVRGAVTHYTVTPAPWQVEMPAMPKLPAQSIVAKPVQPKPQPLPVTVPPLIVSGRKAETATAVSTNPPTVPKTESPLTNSSALSANAEAIKPKSDLIQPDRTNASIPNQSATQLLPPTTSSSKSPADKRDEFTPSSSKTNPVGSSETAVSPPRSPESSNSAAARTLATSGRETFVLRKRLILFSSIAVVLIVGIVLFRRARSTHVSLITHSIDRERE